MNSYKKSGLISGVLILCIVIGIIMFESKPSDQGSSNSIEPNHLPANASVPSKLGKFNDELTPLVSDGYLDNVTKDTVIAAVQKYEADAMTNESSDKSLTLTVLKTNGYISDDVFTKVKVAADNSRMAKKEMKFRPLVSSGAFANTEEAEGTYAVFIKKLGEETVAQKEVIMKEIESADPPLTKEEQQQKKDAFNADRGNRIDDVLTVMVSENSISLAQADALRSFYPRN